MESTQFVPLAELHGRLLNISSSEDPQINEYIRAQGIIYPHLMVPLSLQIPEKQVHVKGKNIFKDSAKSSYRKIVELKNLVVNQVQAIQSSLFDLVAGSFESEKASPVHTIRFHPFKQVLAVIHCQDFIFVYDLNNEQWINLIPKGLANDQMKGIQTLEWNPIFSNQLAAVCRNGIFLWTIPTDACNSRTPISMTFLEALLHPSSCAWSADGRYIAVGYFGYSMLTVWDILTKTDVTISLPDFSKSGTKSLIWSKNGKYLVQIGSSWIKVFETRFWSSKILGLKNECVSALFASGTDKLIYSLKGSNNLMSVKIGGSGEKLEVWPLPNSDLPDAGAEIRNFILDPKAKRLFVEFNDKMVLYKISHNQFFSAEISGEINGPQRHPSQSEQEMPRLCCSAFSNQCDYGSLLSLGWKNGKISFIPIIYGCAGVKSDSVGGLVF